MKWLKKHRWLFAACLAVAVAAVAADWHIAEGLIAPTNHSLGPPPADLPIVAASFDSDSGSKLAAWYIPAENAQATIVLLHPIRCDRRFMLDRARLFHAAGYAVVMVDLQAHGESPGKHITVGYLERHDVRAAVAYARSMNPGHRIAVDGISLGGAATLLAGPLGIDAAVLESVFPTIEEAVYDRIAMRLGALSNVFTPILLWQLQLRLGIAPTGLHPIDHIAEIGCPVLILSGDIDTQTTPPETRRLYETAHEPKQLVMFPGAGHTDLLVHNRQLYESEVLGFLEKHLDKR